MPFALTFTRDALDDLAYLKKYEQRLILDELKAVGYKEHNVLHLRGKEFIL